MMKWIVIFVVCLVLNESVGAPQSGLNLRDDGEIYDDVLKEVTIDTKRVRRDGRTVMDILTGNVPRSSDDVVTNSDYVVMDGGDDVVMNGGDDVGRVTRSAEDPMLISPGPEPCGQARDSGLFNGPYQQQYFDPSNSPQADPKTHKLPVLPIGGEIGGGHGGLLGHQESLLEPVHKDTIYFATIPFISGYKMTPIISNKKVVVKDLPGHGHGHGGLIGGGLGGIGGGLGGGGLFHDGLSPGLPGLPGLPLAGLPGGLIGGPVPVPSFRSSQPNFMTQTDYPCPAGLDDSFIQSRSSHPQDFYVADPGARHPLDLNIFFETPEATAARVATPETLTPETYVNAIRNLQQQMDHLHSLKLAQESRNQPDEINCV